MRGGGRRGQRGSLCLPAAHAAAGAHPPSGSGPARLQSPAPRGAAAAAPPRAPPPRARPAAAGRERGGARLACAPCGSSAVQCSAQCDRLVQPAARRAAPTHPPAAGAQCPACRPGQRTPRGLHPRGWVGGAARRVAAVTSARRLAPPAAPLCCPCSSCASPPPPPLPPSAHRGPTSPPAVGDAGGQLGQYAGGGHLQQRGGAPHARRRRNLQHLGGAGGRAAAVWGRRARPHNGRPVPLALRPHLTVRAARCCGRSAAAPS